MSIDQVLVLDRQFRHYSSLLLCLAQPAGSGVIELAGATCQTDGSDVVGEGDRAAGLHHGDIIGEDGAVVLRMDGGLGAGCFTSNLLSHPDSLFQGR